MKNEEILKEAEKLSVKLADALQNEYINKGQRVPEPFIEIIKLLQTQKKNKP
jgi:hypothetical protein